MNTPSADVLALLMTAVEMRFDGKTWEEIGQKLGRSARTCRRWPLLYPHAWNPHYARLRNQYVLDGGREALARLKQHMRSERANISMAASRHWDNNCDKIIARQQEAEEKAEDPESQKVLALFAQSKGLTDAELVHLLEECLADLKSRAERDSARTAADAPAQPK